jgi:hypothetical protein
MESARPSREIQGSSGPLSELPWSADFVMQAIEVLPVTRRDGALVSFRPEHADSLIVGWPAGARPEEVAAGVLAGLSLSPPVLHSTSWRHAGNEVVLTYLAVISSDTPLPESWLATSAVRAELARGDATAPPPVIDVSQVLEHALRHLAWLLQDDAEIAHALPGWADALKDYIPEPFRALGGLPV